MHRALDLGMFLSELQITNKNMTWEPCAVCSLAYQAEKTSTEETFNQRAKKCPWCSLGFNKTLLALHALPQIRGRWLV